MQNDKLKEALEAERKGLGRYLTNVSKRRGSNGDDLSLIAQQKAALTSQFQKAMQHLATCKRRKCSVCNYTRAVFGNLSGGHPKYELVLFTTDCIITHNIMVL